MPTASGKGNSGLWRLEEAVQPLVSTDTSAEFIANWVHYVTVTKLLLEMAYGRGDLSGLEI